jgi:hypothetical protein
MRMVLRVAGAQLFANSKGRDSRRPSFAHQTTLGHSKTVCPWRSAERQQSRYPGANGNCRSRPCKTTASRLCQPPRSLPQKSQSSSFVRWRCRARRFPRRRAARSTPARRGTIFDIRSVRARLRWPQGGLQERMQGAYVT